LLGHSDDKSGNSTPAIYLPAGTSTTTVNLAGVGLTGNNLPFGIIQPYCTLNLCIAMNGIFPSRN
jgi:microcystin-dependent protein